MPGRWERKLTAVNLNDGPEAGGGAWASVQCTSRLFGEGAARQALGAAGALLDGGGVISVQALNKALADCVRGARMGWSEAASFLSGIGALGGSASGASPRLPVSRGGCRAVAAGVTQRQSPGWQAIRPWRVPMTGRRAPMRC